MQKDIEVLVDKLITDIIYEEEVCAIREKVGKWVCDIGNCDKCGALAVKLIRQRLKEREENG